MTATPMKIKHMKYFTALDDQFNFYLFIVRFHFLMFLTASLCLIHLAFTDSFRALWVQSLPLILSLFLRVAGRPRGAPRHQGHHPAEPDLGATENPAWGGGTVHVCRRQHRGRGRESACQPASQVWVSYDLSPFPPSWITFVKLVAASCFTIRLVLLLLSLRSDVAMHQLHSLRKILT